MSSESEQAKDDGGLREFMASGNAFRRVANQIRAERAAQDQKWGVQDHDALYWLAILTEEVGETAKAIIDPPHGQERLTDEARVELIQVAAVCVAWLEADDRASRGAK